MNIGINDVHDKMSNFEVQAARKQGVSFDVFQEKCSWSSNEIKERIIAARNGAEWQRGEGPNAIREAEEREARRFEAIKDEYSRERSKLLEIIHNRTVDAYYDYLDDEYKVSYNVLTQTEKNELGRTYIHNVMRNMNIPHTNSDRSGIHFKLSDDKEVVVRTKALDNDGWLIHDEISKLKGDIFIYIYNMGQRKHTIYIMTREDVLGKCRYIPIVKGKKPQSVIPQKVLRIYENNFGVLE